MKTETEYKKLPAAEFNKKLWQILLAIAVILIFRLSIAALDSDNWTGFFYSTLHIVIVGCGAFAALADRENKPS